MLAILLSAALTGGPAAPSSHSAPATAAHGAAEARARIVSGERITTVPAPGPGRVQPQRRIVRRADMAAAGQMVEFE